MPQSDRNFTTLWKRDDELYVGESSIHEYCAPYFRLDELHRETGAFNFESSEGHDELRFFAEFPFIRTILRNSPPILLGLYLFLVGYAELHPGASMDGIGSLMPAITSDAAMMSVGVVTVWFVMFVSFVWLYGLTDGSDGGQTFRDQFVNFSRPAGYYVGLGLMTVGSGSSILMVGTPSLGELRPNIVFTSGYFLLLYVGGPMVYDGIHRTERVFNDIDDLDFVIRPITETEFYEQNVAAFNSTRVIMAMGAIFVLPFVLIWASNTGPFNLSSSLLLTLAGLANVLIVALAIHFIILIRLLAAILKHAGTPSSDLTYKPFHPDMAAGFRDLGRFATRVNLLLLLGALYLLYRLYVQGQLEFLLSGSQFNWHAIDIVWTVNYSLPLLAFSLVAFLWFYYSFLLMHRAMKRIKKQQIYKVVTDDYEGIYEGYDWNSIQAAPWSGQSIVVSLLPSCQQISFRCWWHWEPSSAESKSVLL